MQEDMWLCKYIRVKWINTFYKTAFPKWKQQKRKMQLLI